jgi:hypothetical protein
VAAVFAFPWRASAQDLGRIQGYVFDESGVPMKGVQLTARAAADGAKRVAFSDDEGAFLLQGLAPGTYNVEATAPRLKRLSTNGVSVQANATAEVSFVMEPVVRDQSDRPFICFSGPTVVHVDRPGSSIEVNADFLADLPFPPGLAPQAAAAIMSSPAHLARGSLEVHGATAQENAIRVDGFDFVNPYSGRAWLPLPGLALWEVQLRAAGLGPSAPDAVGSAVETASLSGSNRPSASLGGALALERDPGEAYAGLAVAGPVVLDRFWWALSADVSPPRDDGRTGGAGARDQRASLKLTWQIGSRDKLSALAVANHGPLGRGVFQGLLWESLPTDSLVVRMQLSVAEAGERLTVGDAGSSSSPVDWTGRTRAADARAVVEWFSDRRRWGEHSLILDVRGRLMDHRWQSVVGDQTVAGRRLVATLSDRLRPTRHLTLTAGLSSVQGSAGTAFSVWAMSPHLGVAWDETHDARTVLRASLEQRTDLGWLALAHAPLAGDVMGDLQPLVESPPNVPRVTEVTTGAEREVWQGTAIGLELMGRWFADGWRLRLDDGLAGSPSSASPRRVAPPARRYLGLTASGNRRQGRWKFLASYTFHYAFDSAVGERGPEQSLRLQAALALSKAFSAGAFYDFNTTAYGTRAIGHEAGARLQLFLRDLESVRLSFFADGVVAVGAARHPTLEEQQTFEPLTLEQPAFRARLGIEVAY